MPFKDLFATPKQKEKKKEERHQKRKKSISAPVLQEQHNDRTYAIGIVDPRAAPAVPAAHPTATGGLHPSNLTPDEHTRHWREQQMRQQADAQARAQAEAQARAAQALAQAHAQVAENARLHHQQEMQRRQQDLAAARAAADARRGGQQSHREGKRRADAPHSPPLTIPDSLGEGRVLSMHATPTGQHYRFVTPVDPPSHGQWGGAGHTSAQVSPISATAPSWAGGNYSPVSPITPSGHGGSSSRSTSDSGRRGEGSSKGHRSGGRHGRH